MKERLTKLAGRNATYRGERILEIIDKLTDIENKQQSCLDVIPPDYQDRLTIGTLNGNSESAKRNNKLFILENAMEAGGLVSTEWHNEQVMQLQNTIDDSIHFPVTVGTPLFFVCSNNCIEDDNSCYGVVESSDWVYVVSKNGTHIEEVGNFCSFENSYDYELNKTVFTTKEVALEELNKYLTVLKEINNANS